MVEVHVRHGKASPQTGALTDEGRQQAKVAGEYLRREFPRTFEVGINSPSTRATDTALLLGFPTIKWVADKRLREMDWGESGFPKNYGELTGSPEYRSIDWHNPPNGESWKEIIDRVGAVCAEISNLHPMQNRILVYHGNAMHGMRTYRERLTGDQFPRLFEEPYKYFNNCQLIIYTNENPENEAMQPERLWVKSVCPWAEGKYGHDWMLVK